MRRTAATLVVVLAAACSGSAVPAPSSTRASPPVQRLGAARSFREYRLYWLGRRYDGLRLTGVDIGRVDVPNVAHSRIIRTHSYTVTFLYGGCGGGVSTGDESTCTVPLEAQNWPACGRNAALYGLHLPLPVHIRGAPAHHFGDRVEIWTGTSDIVIFGKHPARAARALRSINRVGPSVGPGDRLPPPAPGAIEGRLRCIR